VTAEPSGVGSTATPWPARPGSAPVSGDPLGLTRTRMAGGCWIGSGVPTSAASSGTATVGSATARKAASSSNQASSQTSR